MMILLAGLQAIPEDLYEAASIDGAGALKKFLYITIPGIKNVLIFVVMMTTIAAMKLFTQPYIMTNGGPKESTMTLTYYLYRQGFQYRNMGYVTGGTIRILREKRKLTQKELAEIIHVSDKTISKWETDKGLPDISMIDELARALGVSIAELLTGDLRINENRSANMQRVYFYVCPICGNIVTAVGQGSFSCCGITLPKQEPEPSGEDHLICVET